MLLIIILKGILKTLSTLLIIIIKGFEDTFNAFDNYT